MSDGESRQNDCLKSIEEKLDGLKEQIGGLDSKVDNLCGRMVRVETVVDSVTKQQDKDGDRLHRVEEKSNISVGKLSFVAGIAAILGSVVGAVLAALFGGR